LRRKTTSLVNYVKQFTGSKNMWGTLLKKLANNDNGQEISLFDVKELYDAAYDEKAKARVNLKKFKKLMEKATQLDEAYRAQLTTAQPFQYGKAA